MPSAPMPVRLTSGKNKSTGVAYALWFVFGLIGGHQFYLGHVGRGLFYLFTLGGFLIGWMIDLFTLPDQVRRVNTIGF